MTFKRTAAAAALSLILGSGLGVGFAGSAQTVPLDCALGGLRLCT
ncbi:hypothetical protein [Mycobacterium sp. 141]|nr:hypothetical protein [Mycobacterium sp. 141]